MWYALAPFASSAVVGAAAVLPAAVLFASKTVLAAPLAYHTLNGVRHLVCVCCVVLCIVQSVRE